ncbi:unnamed protein product, partial [Polarella glacialis]
MASFEGHLEVVRLLRGALADVNLAMYSGATPLFIAAQEGFLEIVQYLCDTALADMELAMAHGATPLSIAAEVDHVAVVSYLCTRQADMNKAISRACPDSVGPDEDPEDWDGATPLFIAAYMGHCSVVSCLARHGADFR